MQQTSAEPGYEHARVVVLSPSQIKVWLEGRRKWAWQYIAKAPRKSSASADLGTAVHWQLERHLRGEGFDYSTPYRKRAAEIAILGVPYLPAPRTPGMRVENRLIIGAVPPPDAPTPTAPAQHDKYFSFEMSSGIVYRGTMDVSVPDSIVVPPPPGYTGPLGGAPGVVDHKTTSNIAEYSLSEEDLHTDVQAVIYAYYLMAMYQSPAADLQWNYLSTRTKAVAPRRLRVYSPRVVDEFGKIQAHGSEMSLTYGLRPNPLDLPPCNEHAGSGDRETDPCEAYRGCSFKHLCTDVFSPMGFPIQRITVSEDIMTTTVVVNGTAEGQARMAALAAKAAPDPYETYAAWRATVPVATSAPGYEAFEARYQASLVVVAPPPPPPLPAGITNAPVDFVARPFLTAPAAIPPAINPPEFQPPPTLEERAAVLASVAKHTGKIYPEGTEGVPAERVAPKAPRRRRTNAELAAAKATEPKEWTLYVVDAEGNLTTEVINAAAVFVK